MFGASASVLSSCGGFGIPQSAVSAWTPISPEMELRRWVLSHALLAPNPHNMQPWLADLGVAGEITLRLDTTRLLPETDPFGRQIVIGCGAFLEILSIAATARGHRAEIALFPSGAAMRELDDRVVARIRLIADAGVPQDLLFTAVRNRRTDRRAYDDARPVAAADVATLSAALQKLPIQFGVVGQREAADDAQLRAVRMVASNAWAIELTTERRMMETMRVLRFGSGEIDKHRDGLVITSPMLVTMSDLGY